MRLLLPFAMFLFANALTVHAELYDPFYKSTQMKKVRSLDPSLPPLPPLINTYTPTVVNAVMNDKAFINGAWYKVGDRVNNQQITSITPNFVTLKEGSRLTMLGVGSQRRVLGTKEMK